MEFVGQLSDIGTKHYGVLQAFMYVPMELPTDIYQLFPMAGFLGALIGLGRLATNSELVVMRGAGVSIKRIAWSVAKAGILMVIIMTLIGELFAPMLQHKANHMKSVALEKQNTVAVHSVWLRKNHTFVHVGNIESATKIGNIMRYRFSDSHRLLSASIATSGVLNDGKWKLLNVQQTLFNKKGTSIRHLKEAPMTVNFHPAVLQKARKVKNEGSIVGLIKTIHNRQQAGLVSSQQQFSLWQRLLQPITTIIMFCLGIPFVFGSLRDASMGSRVLTGVVIGFGFYMLNQLFGPISLVYQFPPLLAAVFPPLLFLSIYAILIRRVT
jgi:lipopolysaccharide export system permease protein